MLGSYSIGHAQGKSEQELLKAGNKLFYEENYAGATTYFLQLLSLNQTNAEYNYKYGTCVLHSDGDKNKALKYLLFAAAKPTGLDKEVNYWAARALHLNYRFAEAVKYYQKYAATAGEKEKEKFQVTHQIEMCNNGKRLLRNVTDIVVNSKKDFREADFYALYDKKSVPGKILVVEKLQSSIDKKKEHRIVVNLPRTSDVVYFSSYGDDGKSLDIYRVKRLPGDSWSKPQIVKGSVNTAFDENYPYMHPDGRTLYFCSKGHNSMGGYDIFKSNFDPETETFGQPENMDFAINTPDDDILYILDSLEQSAWFASKRESGFGKVHVYNVKVERYPVLIAILKGRFVNEVTPGKNGVTITVENIVTNEAEGLFNSKSTTGDYLITLDKSGKYRYKVKVEGTDKVYEALVDVPYQKELRPLKQEIALVTKEGTPTLVIRNMFNEEIEGAEDIIAEVLANKASLDPNADKFTNQESVSKGKDSVVDAAISENLTNEDLIKMAKEQADAQKKEADELKEKLEAAYSVAAQKTEEARTKSKDAENNIASGDDIIDPLEKGMLYDQAKKDNEDANKAANEAVIALNLAKNLEKQADKAKKDADVAANYAKGIEEAINSKNKEEAIKKLKEQQAYIKSLMSANAQQDDLYAETKKKAAEKRNEANKALDAANKLKEQENAITADINSLKREEEKAKGDKLKKIQDDIKSLQEDLANATEKKKEAFRKSDALIKEADQIDDQAELLANILENTSGNTKVLTQAEKDAIAGNTQSVSKNIAGNNDKIEQKVQVDRTKKFDYNDFLAKYDYYANMFNEYERLKKSLFTAEDYDRLINHNKNWITDINNDIANTEAAANSTDDPEKKKALSAKKSQLQQLKVTKEQENKDLEVEKQKLLARLAKNNNTDNEVKNLNDPNLNKSLADNDNALKAIDNSNKSDDQKAIEKNKTNNLYIDDLNKQIEKDKKQLAITTDEEQKKKLREKILVEENVKRKKESEIEANENALKNKGFNEELTNTVTDKVKDNSELTNSAEVTKQVKKTNVLKEEINQLEIKKANSKDETEKSNIDKQIDKKKLALYQEEEKLAEAIKTENDKNFNQKDSQLDEKLDKTLIKDENKNIAKNLSVAAENDKKEADKLFQEAKTEQDPTKRNEKFEAAIEKQNDAIRKQNDALTVIDANDTKYLASNDPTNTNGTNNTNGNNGNNGTTNDNNGTNANNGTNNDNNGTNGNNGTTNDNNGSTNNNVAENTYNVDPGNYSDPNAKKELDAVKTTLDKIEQKQSEINNLKAQANKETDPAKKQDLEKRIAEKEKELAKDELAVAKTFEKINSTEIAKNRESVNQLIAKVDPDKLNDQQKTTFNNAKDLFTQSANDAAKADALRIKANDETDPTKKNNYLKEANELEKSAIQKQKEAEKLLNTTLSDLAANGNNGTNSTTNDNNGTNSNNGSTNGTQLTEKEKETLNEVSPDYAKKMEEIRNSGNSEIRKTQAENELNKDAVNKIESEINKLQSDPNTEQLSEEEKRKRKLRIEELNRLLDAKKAELGITEEKLKQANVIANDNQSNKNDYSKTLVVNDKAALAEKAKIDKALTEIAAEKTKLNEVRIKMAESNDQKEQEKLDKEAKAIESKIVSKEIGIAPSIEKINDLEYNSHKAAIAQKQLSATEKGLKLNETSENKIRTLLAEAEILQKDANALREQAAKEKDAAKKNALFKQAHQKETDAIRKLMEAEKVLNDAKLDAETNAIANNSSTDNNGVNGNNGNNGSDKVKNEAVVKSVDNSYEQDIKDIEATNESALNKTLKKEQRNEQLIEKIKEEKLALEKNYSNETPEEKERRRLRLEELNRILDAKQKELDAQKALLASNGISAGNNDKTSYTDPYPVKNASSKSLLVEAQKRIDELKREEAKLSNLEINKAEATTEADKKKFDSQIKAQQKLVTDKELSVAKVYADINKNEAKDNRAELDKLMQRVIDNKNINKNDDKLVAADKYVLNASLKFSEANNLRTKAEKENDKEKKNELLKKAFALEKDGLKDQQEAIAMYETILGNVDLNLASNNGINGNNGTNTNNGTSNNGSNSNDQVEKSLVPEKMEDRASYREQKKFEKLDAEANFLAQRANTVRDSANTVKKKNRPGVIAMADELQKQSDARRTEANLAKNNYETLKQQEEDQLAIEQKRRDEKAAAKELEPEVAKMNEYARYYQLQKDANDTRAKLTENERNEKALRDKAEANKNEAMNLRMDANKETDAAKKTELTQRGDMLEMAGVKLTRTADSLATVNNNLRNTVDQKQTLADNYLNGIDPDKSAKIAKVVGTNKTNLITPEVTYAEITKVDDPVKFAKDFKAPENLTNDIFVKSNAAGYNKDNPIPVNPEGPKGDYFMVQVGAFRNPIPQDLFKEFVPIRGETTNNGLTRYTVGYFTTFDAANNAKKEIRAMGYKDAFVVGFKEGKRANAGDLIANNGNNNPNNNGNNNPNNNGNNNPNNNGNNNPNNNGNNNPNNNGNNNPNNNGNNNPNNNGNGNNNPTVANIDINAAGNDFNNFKPDNSKANYYTNAGNVAKANQVELIKGLFYTVQVGVYSKPVSLDKIYGIQPLNSELTKTNKIRYTTGIYTRKDPANSRKDEARNAGIKDAFVTAYFNGKKITIAEADALVAKYGETIYADPKNLTNNNANVVVNNNPPDNGNPPANADDKGFYTVILGEYAGEVPNKDAEIFLTGNDGYKIQKTYLNNKNVYFVETEKGKNDAAKIQNTFKNKGLTKTSTTTDKLEIKSAPVVDNPPVNNPPVNNDDSGFYTVILGEYTGEVPNKDAEIFLTGNEGNKIQKTYLNNKNIYFIETEKGKNGASQLETTFKGKGLTKTRITTDKLDVKSAPVVNTPPVNNPPAANFHTVVLGEYTGEVPNKDAEIYLNNNNKYKILKTNQNGKSIYFIETEKGKADADKTKDYFKNAGLVNAKVVTTKYTVQGDNNAAGTVVQPKQLNTLRFQVYLGEYLDEVPEDDAMIYINNVDKGVKRKKNDEGYTIYYTCDCPDYEKALELKAHFVHEGITSIRIVPFMNDKEISVGEAFKLIYE